MNTMIKKVFIAQPMNGIPTEEVERRRNELMMIAKKYMEKCGNTIEFIDQYHLPEIPNGGRLHYLGRSIQLLADADMVVFARDYKDAKGCIIEKDICDRYGIKYIIEV